MHFFALDVAVMWNILTFMLTQMRQTRKSFTINSTGATCMPTSIQLCYTKIDVDTGKVS